MMIDLSVDDLRQIQTAFNIIEVLRTIAGDDYHRLSTRINEAVGDPGYMAKRQLMEDGIRQSCSHKPKWMKQYLRELDKEMPLPPAYQCEQDREVRP